MLTIGLATYRSTWKLAVQRIYMNGHSADYQMKEHDAFICCYTPAVALIVATLTEF